MRIVVVRNRKRRILLLTELLNSYKVLSVPVKLECNQED